MKILATVMAVLAIYFAISIVPPEAPDPIAFLVLIGAMISDEPLIYRGEIPPLLKAELGIVLGKSTVSKIFSPAVGQGCEPAAFWNRRPLYRPSDVIAWAKSKLRPGPGMTAVSAKEVSADGSAARTRHEESLTT